MKKVLLFIVVVAMVLSLVACGVSVQKQIEKVEEGMDVDEAIEILGEEYKEIVLEYNFDGESYIIYEQEDNKAAVVHTVDDEVESVEWVEDYSAWMEDTYIIMAKDLNGEDISGMDREEALEMFGDNYEEIVFEYKYAGQSFIIYEKDNNEAIAVYTKDDEVIGVEWVEDYDLWKESSEAVIAEDRAGIEISIDTFIERYNEIIKEYDYDFLLPIDKSDFEALDDVDMLNVDYAYRYNYDDYKYTITYYTDDTDRVLNLMVTDLIDFDEDLEIVAGTHMDLFSIIIRSAIGIDATDVGLDEYEEIGDYGFFNTYDSQFYIIAVRHNDTYED